MKLFRNQRGQVTGPILAAAVAVILVAYAGSEVVKGAKWIGHESKKVGHGIVHVVTLGHK